ncbi:MAG: PatB family C-S lyase [Polyangiaceae bacterium]|jgi:cystathionine beta-lyase
MAHDFDREIDRRSSDSIKWTRYPPDVLPLWVADMDFASPDAVIQALRERVDHGVFGYGRAPEELAEVFAQRLTELYRWTVSPRHILLLPGVVPAIHMACRAFTLPGEAVLVQTPVYPPIRSLPAHCERPCREVSLVRDQDGRFYVDWDVFERALADRARLFVLCNPQNPTGRVFSRSELERFATACRRGGAVILSDEIHCDIVFQGHEHVPIASLAPEVADRTVTLMSPSKTFNLSGLQCAFAVIQNDELRRRFVASWQGLVPHLNALGALAALAAYRHGQAWLGELRAYLQANRDALCGAVRERLPGVKLSAPEGTYLAWLDCRDTAAAHEPYRFFLERARVALGEGGAFGADATGFVRLNFGCTRATLEAALDRLSNALAAAHR